MPHPHRSTPILPLLLIECLAIPAPDGDRLDGVVFSDGIFSSVGIVGVPSLVFMFWLGGVQIRPLSLLASDLEGRLWTSGSGLCLWGLFLTASCSKQE